VEKRAAIQKILSAIQSQSLDVMNASNGVGWMGQSSGLQQQVGEAILSWIEHDDPQPILGVVELMQTFNILTAKETDSLRAEILDAQGRAKRL